jgi:hypothetical protein
VLAKLSAGGLAKEVIAKAGAPVWRRDVEAGRSYSLKLTAAGFKAAADEGSNLRKVADADEKPFASKAAADPVVAAAAITAALKRPPRGNPGQSGLCRALSHWPRIADFRGDLPR